MLPVAVARSSVEIQYVTYFQFCGWRGFSHIGPNTDVMYQIIRCYSPNGATKLHNREQELLSQIAVLCSLISVWFSVVVAVWRFIVTNPSYLVCMWNFVYAYVPCGVPFVVMSMFVFLQRFFVVIWISPTVRGIICFRIAILPWYMIRHMPTEYYVASLMVLISVHL